jgi:hypothetical protein
VSVGNVGSGKDGDGDVGSEDAEDEEAGMSGVFVGSQSISARRQKSSSEDLARESVDVGPA